MYCKNCGTKLDESIAFCPTCGKANESALRFKQISGNGLSGNNNIQNGINANSANNNRTQNGINTNSTYNNDRTQNGINTNSTYNNNRTQNGINANSVNNNRTQNGINANSANNNRTQNGINANSANNRTQNGINANSANNNRTQNGINANSANNRTQNGINSNSAYNDNRTHDGLNLNLVYENNKMQNNDYNYYANGSNYQNTANNPNFSNLSDTAYSANTNAANNVKPKSKKKSRIALIIIPVCIIISAVIACLVLSYFGIIYLGPKSIVKYYFRALENGDSKKMLAIKCYDPDEYTDNIRIGVKKINISSEEYYEGMDICYATFYDSLEEIGDVELHYSISEMENVEELDELRDRGKVDSVTSLEDFQELMEKYFAKYDDFDADKIKKAYMAEIKWYLTVGDDKLEKETSYVYIYKYKWKWYVRGLPNVNSFLNEVDNSNADGEYDDVYSNTKNAIDEQIYNRN
jgi:hypothetical protein